MALSWRAILAVALLAAACDDPAPAESAAVEIVAPEPPAPAAVVAEPLSPPQIPPPAAVVTLPTPKPAARVVRRPGDRFRACDRYDEDVRQQAEKWWIGGPHWSWWRAQIWQESRCNPTARSPVGAEGLAQVMPATWVDIMKRLGEDPKSVPRTHARMSITVGARYMRILKDQWRGWSGNDDLMQVHFHAAGGFNAGSGHILKAWRACGKPAAWDETVTCLPQVTGRHAKETTNYLLSIRRWQGEMDR